MNVLSVFDGMSCGQIALERTGIKVDNYYASEIDKYAIKVTQKNYPNTKHIGSVVDVKVEDLPKIDLLIGGSPCQGFSFAGKQLNFEDPRSKLFFEFVRLKNELNPKYFLLENVKMKKEYQDVISELLGVEPIMINSSLVSAQNRKRLYWTNIPDIDQPEDKWIFLKDIIEHGLVDRDKSYCVDANYFKGGNLKSYFSDSRRQLVFEKPHGWNKGGIKEKDKFDSLRECTSGNYAIYDNGVTKIENHKSNDGLICIGGLNKNKKWLDDGKNLQRNFSQGERIYSVLGKSPTLSSNSGGTAGVGNVLISEDIIKYKISEGSIEKYVANTDSLFCDPYNKKQLKGDKSTTIRTNYSNGNMWVNDNSIGWRKLTPIECERLQTVPDNYTDCVSNSQRYKMLGNGWTVDVIAHIFKGIK
ncbi:MAG: DNA (cytosine-5-)-methyltransferase [Melioribacteraceae bacterium]